MRFRVVPLVSILSIALPLSVAAAQQQAPLTSPVERAALHNSPEWGQIAQHLPDPATADPASLETAADVLRARRFPEDALDYYGYAMARGGNVDKLLNKMGVVRLELQQNNLARQMFLRVVHSNKKDAQGWNNLGVTEYATQHYGAAIADYKRALHYDKRSAVYRSNLGLAYFENQDLPSARQQFLLAIQLDPNIMRKSDQGGVTAHVLESRNYPELCFVMAKMYAASHDLAPMRQWLARASEGGYDVRHGMSDDVVLRPYLNDAQVKMMLANSAQLRKRAVAASTAPSLGETPHATQRIEVD